MKLVKLSNVGEEGVSHNERIRKRVILENGEVGPLTQYARAVIPPGEKADAHTHTDMCEIFTVESGRGEIRIDDVGYVFAAGTTVLVDAGEEHEIINTGSESLSVFYFGVLVD